MTHKSMMQRWIDLFPGVSLDVSLYWYRWVKGHYDAAGRHYHNWQHPEFMHMMCDEYFPNAPRAVRIAIFLHDVAMEPGSKYDVADSVILASGILPSLGVSTEEIELVCSIIASTNHHLPTTWQEKIMCDIDLCALGFPREIFNENSEKIKRENEAFTEVQRRIGRNAFIDAMLSRDRIFFTELFFGFFEAYARDNLRSDRDTW